MTSVRTAIAKRVAALTPEELQRLVSVFSEAMWLRRDQFRSELECTSPVMDVPSSPTEEVLSKPLVVGIKATNYDTTA